MVSVLRTGRGGAASVALLCVLAAPPVAAGPVVLNEVQASNRRTIRDDEGDSPDWVELFNPSGSPVDLGGWTISDDGGDPYLWRFPGIVLGPGDRLVVWCSGKDRRFPAPDLLTQPDSPVPFTPDFVPLGTEWSYLARPPDAAGPPEGWADPSFDDSDWPRAPLPIGFGEDVVESEIPEGLGAVFLRRTFVVDDASAVPNLVLEALYDDGFVAYLNGHRVLDANYFEEEDPTFSSSARSGVEARRTERFDLSPHVSRLRSGVNVLAIAALNLRPSSSDLVLGAELGTVPPTLHTSFRLDGTGGEPILLSDAGGDLVDAVVLPEQATDRSWGRFPEGDGSFAYMLFPTPGEPNDARISHELIPDEILSEPPPGRYEEAVEVTLSANIPFDGFEIRYTLRGATPDRASPLYEGPVELRRDQVVRAAGFLDGEMVTSIASRSYWGWGATTRELEIPVLSLSMEPAEFSFVHNNASGRGRSSEREGFLEVFDGEGRLAAATGMGLRLHGGAGRNGGFNTKKAYRAYFRGIYGDPRLRYRILPSTPVAEFDKLVLRSNFNDAFRTGSAAAYIRDQVIRDLHEDMGALVSHGAWYNLLVNGRYRGVYNVVERMDKEFFASYFPEQGDAWDVVKTGNDVLDGTGAEWAQMRSFFQRQDLSRPENYDRAWELIDVENFTSYMILNIWAQNHDWPHNNWYAARPQRPDGRWIFLSWDAEFGMGRIPGGYEADTFSHVFGRPNATLTIILSGLLESPEYQSYFLEELERHLTGALAQENVLDAIERHRQAIQADMLEEARLAGQSVNTWLANIATMRTFARRRNAAVRSHITSSSRFGLPQALIASPRRLLMDEKEKTISLRGLRFTSSTDVRFAGVPSPAVVFQNSRLLTVTVPFDLRVEGRPAITVIDPRRGRSSTENLVDVTFVRPQPREVQPPSAAPGDVVRILGQDFLQGVRVEFGDTPSPSVERPDDSRQEIRAVVPEGRGEVQLRVVNTRPGDVPAESTLDFTILPPAAARFVRGDADGDGRTNVSDALRILRYLTGHEGGSAPCADPLDVDDTGTVTLTDAVRLLDWLFRGEAAPPASPFPACGEDPTEDELPCEPAGACPPLG